MSQYPKMCSHSKGLYATAYGKMSLNWRITLVTS